MFGAHGESEATTLKFTEKKLTQLVSIWLSPPMGSQSFWLELYIIRSSTSPWGQKQKTCKIKASKSSTYLDLTHHLSSQLNIWKTPPENWTRSKSRTDKNVVILYVARVQYVRNSEGSSLNTNSCHISNQTGSSDRGWSSKNKTAKTYLKQSGVHCQVQQGAFRPLLKTKQLLHRCMAYRTASSSGQDPDVHLHFYISQDKGHFWGQWCSHLDK